MTALSIVSPVSTDARELLALARSLLHHAYAPYSRFPVAAVVVDEQGLVFGGVNVENASYGLTICAERVAIFSAVASGAKKLVTLALTAEKLHPASPCGACRQVMAEFFDADARVHSDMEDGQIITWTIRDLLPFAFLPEALDKKAKAGLRGKSGRREMYLRKPRR